MFYLGAEWNHVNQIFRNFSALLLKITNISGMLVNFTDDYIQKNLASI